MLLEKFLRAVLPVNRETRYKYDAAHIIFDLFGTALFMYKQIVCDIAQRVIPVVRGVV